MTPGKIEPTQPPVDPIRSRVFTKVNGKHVVLSAEQMDEILGKCIVCGHVFGPRDNFSSKIVDYCLRFVCDKCWNKP